MTTPNSRRIATPTSCTVNTPTPSVVSRLVPTSAITAPMKKVIMKTMGSELIPASCIIATSGVMRRRDGWIRLRPSAVIISPVKTSIA